MITETYEETGLLPPRERLATPTRPLPRLQPYFLDQGDEAGIGHDFLLQNPRPDLTETDLWPLATDRRKLALDLP
jgi:hypothetical protein